MESLEKVSWEMTDNRKIGEKRREKNQIIDDEKCFMELLSSVFLFVYPDLDDYTLFRILYFVLL